MHPKYLLVIAGPTASGKTDLAVQLGKHFSTCVLSADSRQFYRELSIGTAKPQASELGGVKHYFFDTKSVDELYGAGHYAQDALELLEKLYQEKDIVIIAGGSGLYLDAVINGVDEFEETLPGIREELNSSFAEKGIEWLREELRKNDEAYFNEVDTHNPQRMIRALEIIRSSGKKFSDLRKGNEADRNFHPIRILLDLPRAELYDKINRRVDEMMERGLLEEVKNLVDKKQVNALKTVGYKELYEYLEGKTDLKTAVEKIKQHTRNFAKRQFTWFRNRGRYKAFHPAEVQKIIDYIHSEIKKP